MKFELTERERTIYEQIVILGLNAPQISKKLNISVPTVKTHIEAICEKLGFDSYTRTLQLTIDYWRKVVKGEEKMTNCTLCKFFKNNFCLCPESQYYNPEEDKDEEQVNEYMICREFEGKTEAKRK